MKIKDFELVQTCGACPEQYDVFKDGEQVGYLRLRHGRFSARFPNSCGEEVYTANPKGDGIFQEDERMFYLTLAINAIESKL